MRLFIRFFAFEGMTKVSTSSWWAFWVSVFLENSTKSWHFLPILKCITKHRLCSMTKKSSQYFNITSTFSNCLLCEPKTIISSKHLISTWLLRSLADLLSCLMQVLISMSKFRFVEHLCAIAFFSYGLPWINDMYICATVGIPARWRRRHVPNRPGSTQFRSILGRHLDHASPSE